MRDIAAFELNRIEDRYGRSAKVHSASTGFGVAQPECTARQVNIGPAQRQRFAESHAGSSKQPHEQDKAREPFTAPFSGCERTANLGEFVIAKVPLAVLLWKCA